MKNILILMAGCLNESKRLLMAGCLNESKRLFELQQKRPTKQDFFLSFIRQLPTMIFIYSFLLLKTSRKME